MTDMNTTPIDQRSQDRRRNNSFISLYQLGIKKGRRINKRRAGPGPAYVDTYSNHLFWCAIAILVLSGMDALLTLNILAMGGTELNSFMAILIENSTENFVGVKLALTSFALIFLVIHHNVELRPKLFVKHVLYLIMFGYVTLISYEIMLLFTINSLG